MEAFVLVLGPESLPELELGELGLYGSEDGVLDRLMGGFGGPGLLSQSED